MDNQKKDHIDKKKHTQMNHPKQLQTHNVLTYDEKKILTAQIREETYDSQTSRRLFAKKQKEWRKGSRGTGALLYIDQNTHKESKTSRKNLAMVSITQDIRKSHKFYQESHENLEWN